METRSEITKIVTKVPLNAAKTDFAYCQTQSYQARLAALEEIRQDYHHWKYNAEPRFQRVYQIASR